MQLYDWLETLEERQRQALSNDQGTTVSQTVAHPSVIWLHCSVGAEVGENEDEDEEHVQVCIQPTFSSCQGQLTLCHKQTQIKPLRGFDRLAAAGFSEEDIANFRRTFHS